MITATLVAALVAGLAGSVHCFGMCGGIAGAFGMRARAVSTSVLSNCSLASLYHVGRIASYALLGALFGSLGHSAHALLRLTRFESSLRFTAGIVMVLIALRILTRWNPFAKLEKLGARLWVLLRPLAGRAAMLGGPVGTFATGLLWGLLPCGLVYSTLLLALTSGNALTGASVMTVFGLGTMPLMVAATLIGGGSATEKRSRARFAMGAVLLTFGLWTLFAANPSANHHDHSRAVVKQEDAIEH